MKNLVYLSCTNFGENEVGIGYKIYLHTKILHENGYNVKVINPYHSNLIRRILSWFPFWDYNHDYNEVLNTEMDVLFIRYYMSDFALIELLKKLKKKKVFIIIEIPTYPYDGEYSKKSVVLFKDKIVRRYIKKYVDRIITYSDDKTIFGVPTVIISNGVDTSRISPRKANDETSDCINIIAVAQISMWHGYDRVIEGLRTYYNNGGTQNIIIHIVGNGDNKIIESYKKLVNAYNLNRHVVFYGRKDGKELDGIYNSCSLAFDSLGRHRSKVFYNSSLKGKEYMAKGLPIISGVKTELDDDKDFPFYFRVPADDSPINFDRIIDFHNEIYSNFTSQEIIDMIRSYCVNKFDMRQAFRPVVKEIDKMLG